MKQARTTSQQPRCSHRCFQATNPSSRSSQRHSAERNSHRPPHLRPLQHPLAGFLFFLSCFIILLFTVGKTFFEVPGLWLAENQRVRAIKPIPLDDLWNLNLFDATFDYFGNTLLFLPFGFFLCFLLQPSLPAGSAFLPPTLVSSPPTSVSSSAGQPIPGVRRCSRGSSLKVVALLAFLTSLCIEITQYTFAIGRSDVDDLLFNTLGAVLGGQLLLWALRSRALKPHLSKR